ncbi:MAG: hypothetical protein QW570_07530, partial [Candidatus Caldarchaeum sp.]
AQVGVLGITGLPLTLRWGALGTCAAVGLALLVGLGLAYRYIRREASISVISSLTVPLLAGGATLAGYGMGLRFILGEKWGALTQFVAKFIYTVLAFSILTIAANPQGTWKRIRYVGRLIRGEPKA